MRNHKLATVAALLVALIGLGILSSRARAQGQAPSHGQDKNILNQILTAVNKVNTDMTSRFVSLTAQMASGFSNANTQVASGFSQVNGTLKQINGTLNTVSGQVSGLRVPSNSRTILLLPFVTNQNAFDTGVTISNTTDDGLGTTLYTGACTICYYGGTTGGGAAPPCQTSGQVSPGKQLVFTIGIGGNLGIQGTPAFQGYLIVKCNFPGAHGLAFATNGEVGFATPVHVLPEPRNLSFVEQLGQ
jgi:hypothetical protein